MSIDHGSRIVEWKRACEEGTFEEAMAALEAIVALLDNGALTLEESVEFFEIGARLSQRCQLLLEQAQLRIELIQQSIGPFEEQASEPPF